jgi:CheY-like chemotaxis protein
MTRTILIVEDTEPTRDMLEMALMPIMVVSGDNDPSTLERLVNLGASAYFPKPYSPSQVRQRLEELIDEP